MKESVSGDIVDSRGMLIENAKTIETVVKKMVRVDTGPDTKSILGTLWRFAKQNKTNLGLYLLLTSAYPISEVLLPNFYGKLIDIVSKSSIETLWMQSRGTIFVIGVLWIIVQCLYIGLDKTDARFIPKLQDYIRVYLVERILRAYQCTHIDPAVGDLIAKVIKLPLILRDLFQQVRMVMLPTLLVLIAALIYLFVAHPYLGLAFLAGLVVFFGLLSVFAKKAFDRATKTDKAHSTLHEEISDLLTNMPSVFTCGTIQEELKRLEDRNSNYSGKLKETILLSGNLKIIYNFLFFLIFIMVGGTAFRLYATGKITLQKLSAVLIMMVFVLTQLGSAANEIRDFVFNIGVLQSTQRAIYELPLGHIGLPDMPTQKMATLFFKDVHFSPGGDFHFKVPHLLINNGEKIAIKGHIGSGKSTLVKMAMKYIDPDDGALFFNGIALSRVSPYSVRQNIGYVPQQPILFNRSVWDNISYGLPNLKKEQVIAFMRKHHLCGLLPLERLDTMAGKGGCSLSGGQRQLVHLLRICFRPHVRLLILDEPTSALDKESRNTILQVLNTLVQDRTVLIISHDTDVLGFAGRLLTMEKGTIVQDVTQVAPKLTTKPTTLYEYI